MAAASGYAYDLYLTLEQRHRVISVSRQGPVLTHGLVVRPALSPDVVQRLTQALLALGRSADKMRTFRYDMVATVVLLTLGVVLVIDGISLLLRRRFI